MTRDNSLEQTLAQTVPVWFTSIAVPAMDHRAIRERAADRNVRTPYPRRQRLALAALLLLMICGALAVPGVSANVAMAANSIWTRIIYVTFGTHGRKEEVPETITLDEAAKSTAFAFIMPRGLPQDAKLVSVLQAPSGLGGAITLTYALENGKTFTVAEKASPALLTITRCFPTAANNSPAVSRQLAEDAEISRARSKHERFMLNVVFSNACPVSWKVRGTELTIANMGNALSETQLRSIITNTSR